METLKNNPFVATLGTTFASCPFPVGHELKTDGKKFFWSTGFGKNIEVAEKQYFDDFGNVKYEITFP